MILGIDVGGTTVKFGVVSTDGEISHVKSFETASWVSAGFVESLKKGIKEYLDKFETIAGVGIGWPGLLSVERTHIIELPNIPAVKDVPVLKLLKEAFPDMPIKIENDAKCATIGELYFGKIKDLDNFILVTLGTGVGSGAVIDKKLFLGARGNGMEIGHMLLEDGKSLEQHIGIQHIINYAQLRINQENPKSVIVGREITPKLIFEAAQQGDKFAISVFDYVGEKLGENLVSVVRVLDITTILLGGGIAGAFDFIVPRAKEVMEKYLPKYYMKDLKIEQAFLSNQVGILGAAGLLMENVKK
jgi:glucokinase